MLTSQDVISAYKLVLGREPESSAVIENYVKHSDFDHLRGTLLGSSEFAGRLSRDPRLLGVPMAALSASEEVRQFQSLLEALVALALPLWDQSVLIVGDDVANLAGFFLDRRCRVSVAASPATADLLKLVASSRRLHAANLSFAPHDFSQPIDDEALGRFDLVYGQMPDESSDIMRLWLDNAAESCTKTMLVACSTAPGRSEDIFVTPSPRAPQRYRTIATKKWIFARLRERFEYIYEPMHASLESSTVQGGLGGSVATQATYVASRAPLSLSSLKEYVATTAPPQFRGENGATARM